MPARFLAACALALALLSSLAAQDKKPATIGGIDRKDPRIDELIPKDAKIEVVAEGFKWTEGPVWVKDGGGHLLFTDIPNNRVMK
jgi:gluconolactonase